MKRMKVSDLEKFLSGFKNKNAALVIVDTDGAELAVTDIIKTQGGSLGFETQEEFPDSWYDENGNEIIWDLDWTKEIERSTFAEEYELEVQKPGLIDATMVVNFRIYDGFAVSDKAGVMMTYPKTADLTPEQIDEINTYGGGAVADSKTVLPRDVALKYGELRQLLTVMDTTNSHDQGLVDAINVAWSLGSDRFRTILIALYDRDIDEIFNSPAFLCGWYDNDEAFSDLQTNWQEHAYNYLMHIADNQDLETILKFVKK